MAMLNFMSFHIYRDNFHSITEMVFGRLEDHQELTLLQIYLKKTQLSSLIKDLKT